MLDCKICGFISKSKFGLANHIRYKHIKLKDIESIESYYIKYNMKDGADVCENPNCNTKTKFISLNVGYSRHCSTKCSQTNPNVKKNKYENTKKAMLKKYGVDNPSKIIGNSEKVKKTKLIKYGNENFNNSDKAIETNLRNHGGVFSTSTKEYKLKYKNTVIEKYGVNHHTQSYDVKLKSKLTNQIRYSVDYPMQNSAIKDKMMNTNIEKYGGVLNSSDILSKKIKETNLHKYGVENPMQNEEIRNKVSITNLERYGSTSPLQNKNILNKLYGVDNILLMYAQLVMNTRD
jgi:hypothetical protein